MRDFLITLPALQSWKQGVTAPGKLASKAWRNYPKLYIAILNRSAEVKFQLSYRSLCLDYRVFA
jgi:hypothetical protein